MSLNLQLPLAVLLMFCAACDRTPSADENSTQHGSDSAKEHFDTQPSGPCVIRSADGTGFVKLYAAPDGGEVQLAEIVDGETEIVRLGNPVQADEQLWEKISYDGYTAWVAAENLICRIAPSRARVLIEPRAREIINLLQSHDFEGLGELVHPTKGVRFSPYSFIEPETDIVFSAEKWRMLTSSADIRQWGYFAGSGEEIELSFADYFDRFVMDRNFAEVKVTRFNETEISGNTFDNSFEVYPNAIIVEFHNPDSALEDGSNDWRSLRLAYELYDHKWYLVGVIHDEWTP